MIDGENPPNLLEQANQLLNQNPELTRRGLLLGSVGIALSGGLAVLLKSKSPGQAGATDRLMPVDSPPSTIEIATTSTTTATTSTTIAPKPQPPPEQKLQAAEYHKPIGPEAFITSHLDKIPRLEQLAQWFPNSGRFTNWQDQLTHLDNLVPNSVIDIQEFLGYAPNLDYTHVFDAHPFEGQYINPTMYVFHWTVDMPASPGELAKGMMNHKNKDGSSNRTSVYEYTDDAVPPVVYRLLDETRQKAAHAAGGNDFTQGNEMKARDLMDIRPDQVKAWVMAWVRFCLERGLPVDRTSVIGHYELDLLVNNPNYDPDSGTFIALPNGVLPHINKFDGPRELIEHVIIPTGNDLFNRLKAAGIVQ